MLNKQVTYKEARIMLDQYGKCCVQAKVYTVCETIGGSYDWVILFDRIEPTKWWHRISPQRKYAIFDTLKEAETYMNDYLDKTKTVIYKPLI
jgi:hypothetical protein